MQKYLIFFITLILFVFLKKTWTFFIPLSKYLYHNWMHNWMEKLFFCFQRLLVIVSLTNKTIYFSKTKTKRYALNILLSKIVQALQRIELNHLLARAYCKTNFDSVMFYKKETTSTHYEYNKIQSFFFLLHFFPGLKFQA